MTKISTLTQRFLQILVSAGILEVQLEKPTPNKPIIRSFENDYKKSKAGLESEVSPQVDGTLNYKSVCFKDYYSLDGSENNLVYIHETEALIYLGQKKFKITIRGISNPDHFDITNDDSYQFPKNANDIRAYVVYLKNLSTGFSLGEGIVYTPPLPNSPYYADAHPELLANRICNQLKESHGLVAPVINFLQNNSLKHVDHRYFQR